jgi:hypothetical protein
MIRLFCLAVLTFLTSGSFAQNVFKPDAEYIKMSSRAYSLYTQKAYMQSALTYDSLFSLNNGKGAQSDMYNAACSWALAGNADKAFDYLHKAVDTYKWHYFDHTLGDSDLSSLHGDKRWQPLIVQVKRNKEQAEANLDKPLVAMLDTIYNDDQQYRVAADSVQKKYGFKSQQVQSLWQTILEKDSVNLIKVEKILNERGWLGADVVGDKGNLTLFLVIQHSNLKTQEKYLPMMREAVKNGKAIGSELALLADRVAIGEGRRQVYGSQVGIDEKTGEYYVLPLDDPDNVDARRAAVGLGPLKDYVANWGLTWDAEAYKKKLPEIEAKQKQKQ